MQLLGVQLSSNSRPGSFTAPLLGLCALLISNSVTAATEGPKTSGIGPIARSEIQIALSVRPTLAVRRTLVPADKRRQLGTSFCFWSNSPMSRYNVTIDTQQDLGISKPRAVMQSGNLECLAQGPAVTLLNELESTMKVSRVPSVVNLVISPE